MTGRPSLIPTQPPCLLKSLNVPLYPLPGCPWPLVSFTTELRSELLQRQQTTSSCPSCKDTLQGGTASRGKGKLTPCGHGPPFPCSQRDPRRSVDTRASARSPFKGSLPVLVPGVSPSHVGLLLVTSEAGGHERKGRRLPQEGTIFPRTRGRGRVFQDGGVQASRTVSGRCSPAPRRPAFFSAAAGTSVKALPALSAGVR